MFNQTFYTMAFILIALLPSESSLNLSAIGMSYALLLFVITLQKKCIKKYSLQDLTQIEILIFFGVSFNLWGFSQVSSSLFITTCAATLLYLAALFVFSKESLKIIFPFFIPLLLLALLSDISFSWPLLTLFSIFCIFFLPRLLIIIWGSIPFQNQELDSLCKKAHFSTRGFYIWKALPKAMNGAVFGVISQSRYILLTEKLIHFLPQKSLNAVVAHEIGHSKCGHLVFLPLVLMAGLIPLFVIPLQNPLVVLVYFLFLALYFRFIFGFYSRLFERQADLYGMKLDIPLEDSIEALNQVGFYSGCPLEKPNWHHYSLKDRIAFLRAVQEDQTLARDHDKKACFWMGVFLIALLTIMSFLILRGLS